MHLLGFLTRLATKSSRLTDGIRLLLYHGDSMKTIITSPTEHMKTLVGTQSGSDTCQAGAVRDVSLVLLGTVCTSSVLTSQLNPDLVYFLTGQGDQPQLRHFLQQLCDRKLAAVRLSPCHHNKH